MLLLITLKPAARLNINDRLATVPGAVGVDEPPFVGPWFTDIRREGGSTTILTENGGRATFADTDLVVVGTDVLRWAP